MFVIWYIFPGLVCCTKKNLATLVRSRASRRGECLFTLGIFLKITEVAPIFVATVFYIIDYVPL
jgi:hypothetical protein